MQQHYSTPEAAAYLRQRGIKVTPGTLNTWRHLGRGPSYKRIYARVYYEQPALDRFAEGQPVKTIDSVEA